MFCLPKYDSTRLVGFCTFRKLDAVSDRLKRLRVNSALGSRDIAQAILDCIGEIEQEVQDYTVSRLFYRYGLCFHQVNFMFRYSP